MARSPPSPTVAKGKASTAKGAAKEKHSASIGKAGTKKTTQSTPAKATPGKRRRPSKSARSNDLRSEEEQNGAAGRSQELDTKDPTQKEQIKGKALADFLTTITMTSAEAAPQSTEEVVEEQVVSALCTGFIKANFY